MPLEHEERGWDCFCDKQSRVLVSGNDMKWLVEIKVFGSMWQGVKDKLNNYKMLKWQKRQKVFI